MERVSVVVENRIWSARAENDVGEVKPPIRSGSATLRPSIERSPIGRTPEVAANGAAGRLIQPPAGEDDEVVALTASRVGHIEGARESRPRGPQVVEQFHPATGDVA